MKAAEFITKEFGNALGRPALRVGTPALRRPPRLPTAEQCNPTTPPAFTKKPPQPPTLSVKKGHRSANVPTSPNRPDNSTVHSYGGSLQGAGGIGGMLAMSVGAISPQHYYYHADGNGNNTALINASQAVAAKYLYDAFGNLLSQSGPMAAINHYRFSSKEALDKSGLVYYLYRFYDPSLQRWVNRDPLGQLGFELIRRNHIREERGSSRLPSEYIEGGNLFAFVLNSPVFHTDRYGLIIDACTAAKIALAGC